MNAVRPCILCGTPTRGRGILIPGRKDRQTLAALGVAIGDALSVPLCIGHRMTRRLTDRVAEAVVARARMGLHP